MIRGSFTANSQSSDAMQIRGKQTLSLSGTWVATVTLEHSPDEGANFFAVETFVANIQVNIEGAGGIFRLSTTAYTSGTVDYQIGEGV